MTISNSSRTAGPFIGNGIVTVFPFSYKVFARSDLLVARTVVATNIETVLTLDSDYTVTLNANQNADPGGIITLSTPLAIGTTMAATSNISITQPLDLTNNGGFYPTVINDALDRMVITIQQLAAKVGIGALNVGAASALAAVLAFSSNISNAAGSSLVGFVQAGTDAVVRTLQDKNRESVSPEDFGAKCNGLVDDGIGWQKAINSFPQGSSIAIRLTPGKTYYLKSTVSSNNRSVVVDCNNAIVLISAKMDYGLRFVGTNCEMRNAQINLVPGVTVTAGIYVSGLQHVMRNVTSRAQNWPLFMHCQDMKESHLENIRVDNDVTNKTGIAVQFDYCVNNTVSNSMVGYCAQAFYGSGVGHPTYGYHNEGILFNNVITVYAGRAVNFDNGTFIAINNCLFDFCEIWGVFVSNGSDLAISNTWIASNLTDGFLGVGTGPNVASTTVQGSRIVRGAGAIAGTAGFSLPGQNAVVMGNILSQGMNGGVVTHPTSQVFGNAVTGTPIFADEPALSVRGSLAVSKDVVVDRTLTVAGSSGIFPSALSGSATAGGGGTVAPPATVAAFGSVNVGGVPYKVAFYNP